MILSSNLLVNFSKSPKLVSCDEGICVFQRFRLCLVHSKFGRKWRKKLERSTKKERKKIPYVIFIVTKSPLNYIRSLPASSLSFKKYARRKFGQLSPFFYGSNIFRFPLSSPTV